MFRYKFRAILSLFAVKSYRNETFEKCSILFKFKESENFNRSNVLNISRIAVKVSADASLRITKVPKFEPDTEIWQINAGVERECFSKVSKQYQVILTVTALSSFY